MWIGLIQSVEGFNKTKTDYFQARGNSGSRWSLNLNWNIKYYFSLAVFGLELQLWPFPESPVCWPSLLILDLPASIITWTILQSKFHTHPISFVWRTLTVMGNYFPTKKTFTKGDRRQEERNMYSLSISFGSLAGWSESIGVW